MVVASAPRQRCDGGERKQDSGVHGWRLEALDSYGDNFLEANLEAKVG